MKRGIGDKEKDREDRILRWARFVRENPDKWKSEHTQFINSQFEKSREFYARLIMTKSGKEKIIKIFGIKNKKDYPKLFS